MNRFIKLILSIGICFLAGAFGTIFTISSIPTWYQYLNKPSFSPPNWLFGPIWTTLYILMGISLYRILNKNNNKNAIKIFIIQLFLNAIWTPIFFGLKNLGLGFVVIIFLWYFIYKTIKAFEKIDKIAAYLLLPYISWVSIATVLNLSVWLLNR